LSHSREIKLHSEDGFNRVARAVYSEQCNDLWEHQYGITIETLDNPGWKIRIDLTGTAMAGVTMKEIGQLAGINHDGVQGKQDWLQCRVEGNCFIGAGGPFSLPSICDAFRAWVEDQTSPRS
jgi:hypothetical protein